MSYTALYRKFRPSRFEDVKGQDHIVTTLKNQIKAGRMGHAYLFCGTRGTGKTTIAKIFAKAVNCESPVDGSPCGECETCRAIANGSAINVVEMDAASNRKIEDIRNVIEEVAYPPVSGKYKVYIIDEVHMLTEQASNALLKTLEEPPAYVIFILATTDPQTLLTTILSRCQRYDFRRIEKKTIAARLREVVDAEGQEVEDKALAYVAKCADGSMRDALSLLDQCIAFHLGDRLTYDMTLEVLGAVDTEVYSGILRAVMKKNISDAIYKLDELISLGRDMVYFVEDFSWYLRNLLLIKTNENMEDLIDMSTENLEALKTEASEIDQETLIRYIQIFCELANRIKREANKRVLIEIALIRLCTPQMDSDISALNQRIFDMEEKIENGSFTVSVSEGSSDSTPRQRPVEKKLAYPPAMSEDIKKAVSEWRDIQKTFTGMIGIALKDSKVKTTADDTFVIVCTSPLGQSLMQDQSLYDQVSNTICSALQKDIKIKICTEDTQPDNIRDQMDSVSFLEKGINGMKIEISEN